MTFLKLRRSAYAAIFLLIFSVQVFAQNARKVSGKVTSSTGAAVAGASVVPKGSRRGTTTDGNGNYSINVPSGTTTLVISSIGFATQEVTIGSDDMANAQLAESSDKLSDIVVVGYGTQRKREVSSAITTVTAEQFNKGNIADVSQLLQGKVAGLSVSRAGGNPNNGFDIRLRGLSTLGTNATPLVVLDGQVGADLNTVDPNDIASIDILKDGSSAAIYGTRGSAGVLIISTKKGAANTSNVSYNGSVTVENAARLTHHMSASQFRALIKQSGVGTDYGANTDWYKEILRSGVSHTHNLSFSGGTAHTTYNASINFRNTEGIAITTGFQQLNGRLNLTHKALNDKLVFNVEVSTTRKSSDFGFENAFEYAVIYNPTSPVYSKDPKYDLTGGGYFEVNSTEYSNPVAVLKQNTNHGDLKRLNLMGSAELEIFKGLKILTRYAQQSSSNYGQQFSPSTGFIDRGFFNGVTGFGRKGYSYKQDDESFSQLYENILTYNKKINELSLNAVAGYSYQDFHYEGFGLGGGNFISDLSGQDFSTAQDFGNALGSESSYKNGSKLVAFFGRLNLNYKNTFYLMGSIRREGSTEFGANNKWGNFPAVSAAIDVARLADLTAFSTLKARGSFGVTGNLPPQPYLSQAFYSGVGNYLINGNWISTYGPTQNQNPDLKWEKKSEIDIGADFTVFNNRLSGTIDYYSRKTKDLIYLGNVPAPPALVSTEWLNVGDLSSSGFELALKYDVFKNTTVGWNTGVNVSTYKNKLTRLDSKVGVYIGQTNLGSPGQEATQITRTTAGSDIGNFYNAVYRGVDKDGHYLFDDGTGKAVIASLEVKSPNYQRVIGNGLPKYEVGWANTFTYKHFELNIFLRGAFGHELINTLRAFYENPTVTNNYNVVNTKYFNPNLKDGQIFSSLFVEKADFVKLDNATLAYTFGVPSKGAFSTFKSIRAYVSGYNLFVITGYTGADPEVRYKDVVGTSVQTLSPGIDRRATWVMTRSFTLGVNLGF